MKVTFIGLGNMGSGMARNILNAGIDLTVWNRTQSKEKPFIESGAKGAASAAAAVADADLVITSLMDDKSIEQLLTGEANVLSAMKSGAIHLCVTTISPRFARDLKALHEKHGTQYVSGPVVGRPDASEDGSLITLLGGRADAVAKIMPVCETYCRKTVNVSEYPHVANVTKLGINYMVVTTMEAISETFALLEANDVDTGILANFLTSQFYAHPTLKMYVNKIESRDFQGHAGFAMAAGLKDIRLMIEAGGEEGVCLDIAKIIEGKMMEALNKGMENRDWSSIYEITRDRAGLK